MSFMSERESVNGCNYWVTVMCVSLLVYYMYTNFTVNIAYMILQ
jgi:hypothetical protein